MNKSCFTLLLLVAITCSLAMSVEAGEGFKVPSLNPFATKKKPAQGRISDDSPGATTIPSAGGVLEDETPKATKPTKSSKFTNSAPAQPSTWQKLNSGTQSFFAKSKGVLMPWSKPKPPAQLTGTKKVYPGSAKAKKPAPKKSIFGSMFGGGDTRQEPESVDDFIGQPRPPF